jgi:hypothetical protein
MSHDHRSLLFLAPAQLSPRHREKALGCVHIPVFAQHRINQIAIPIDGTVEVFPDSSDFDVRFIHVPGAASLSLPFASEFVGKQGSKAGFPLSNSLMRELEAAFKEHLSQVTKAEFVAHAPEHDEQHDVSWELKKIEGRVGPFVELTPTCGAAKDAVAKLCSLRQFRRGRVSAVRADQLILPGTPLG